MCRPKVERKNPFPLDFFQVAEMMKDHGKIKLIANSSGANKSHEN